MALLSIIPSLSAKSLKKFMQVSYNLKYQKSNFLDRVLIEKEGEVIIYDKGFRLKGKGAGDKGELISFSEIKEFYYKNDKLLFITFNKEKYALSNLGTQFDEFLRTIYKARNEFLVDALFMKHGKLVSEFEGSFERISKFNKPINKGHGKIKLHERSIIIVPENQDAFSVNFNFVSFHEFDEDDYRLKITMDDGVCIFISQLGNDFEFFQEGVENVFGAMYEKIVNNDMKDIFCEFDAATLLKLAYKIRGGKSASLKEIRKINKVLEEKVMEFFFDDPFFKEKCEVFDDVTDEYTRFFGISRDPFSKDGFIRWIMYAVPANNIVAFSVLPKWTDPLNRPDDQKIQPSSHDMYFFKIIMEKGVASEKVEDKVLEIEQSLITLNFAKDPCYKDKHELKNSPYKYAIRKLPFLRILRKSFVGKASMNDVRDWKKQAQEIMNKSKINN